MPMIMPIKELRDTNNISNICSSSKEPIFITKNGYGDMVIMSMSLYEEKMAKLEMYESIMLGLKDYDEGKLIEGNIAINKLRNSYRK